MTDISMHLQFFDYMFSDDGDVSPDLVLPYFEMAISIYDKHQFKDMDDVFENATMEQKKQILFLTHQVYNREND